MKNTPLLKIFIYFFFNIEPTTQEGKVEITVGELRKLLLTRENLYARWADYKRRVVQPLVDTINDKTCLDVELNVSKRDGNTPTHILFKFIEKPHT